MKGASRLRWRTSLAESLHSGSPLDRKHSIRERFANAPRLAAQWDRNFSLVPASSVRQFTDPDDYSSSFRDFQYELNVTVGGGFAAEHVRLDLHELRLQHYSSNLPWVAHTAIPDGRARLCATRRARAKPAQSRQGDRDDQHRAACPRANDLYPLIGRGVVGDDLPFTGCAGCDRHNDGQSRIHDARGRDDGDARVRNDGTSQAAHAAAGRLATTAPHILAHPEAARSLEHDLARALAACIEPETNEEDASAKRRHAVIMRRFQALVAASCDRPVYTTDLCAAIGVSDRTLEVCCREHLGMSPQKYLRLRRIQRVRRALALADPRSGTVTGIATAHGFWDWGALRGSILSKFRVSSQSETWRLAASHSCCAVLRRW